MLLARRCRPRAPTTTSFPFRHRLRRPCVRACLPRHSDTSSACATIGRQPSVRSPPADRAQRSIKSGSNSGSSTGQNLASATTSVAFWRYNRRPERVAAVPALDPYLKLWAQPSHGRTYPTDGLTGHGSHQGHVSPTARPATSPVAGSRVRRLRRCAIWHRPPRPVRTQPR